VVLRVPISGEPDWLNRSLSTGPEFHALCDVRLNDQELVLCHTVTHHNREATRAPLEHALSAIRANVDRLATEIVQFNATLQPLALEEIQKRKAKLSKDRALLEGLGFPLRRREDAPAPCEARVERKAPRIVEAASRPQREAELLAADYEQILQDLQRISEALERNPRAFEQMNEESLRWVLLVPLNVSYDGQATGEAFNC